MDRLPVSFIFISISLFIGQTAAKTSEITTNIAENILPTLGLYSVINTLTDQNRQATINNSRLANVIIADPNTINSHDNHLMSSMNRLALNDVEISGDVTWSNATGNVIKMNQTEGVVIDSQLTNITITDPGYMNFKNNQLTNISINGGGDLHFEQDTIIDLTLTGNVGSHTYTGSYLTNVNLDNAFGTITFDGGTIDNLRFWQFDTTQSTYLSEIVFRNNVMNHIAIDAIQGNSPLRFEHVTIDDLIFTGNTGYQTYFVGSNLSNVILNYTIGNITISGGSINGLELNQAGGTVAISQDTLLQGDIKINPGSYLFFEGGSNSTSDPNAATGNSTIASYQMDGILHLIAQSANDQFDLGHFNMNGGQVLVNNVYNRTNSYFAPLHFASLSGNGTFELVSDVANGNANTITVTGQANGQFGIRMTDTGEEPAADTSLDIISIGGGKAEFTLLNTDQLVDVGTYKYGLTTDDQLTWRLAPVSGGPSSSQLSPTTLATIATSVTNPTLIQSTADGIHNQLGNLGNSVGSSMSMGGGRSKIKVNNKDNVNFNQDIQLVMLSYSHTLELADDDLLTLGVYGGSSDSDLDLKANGSGKVMSYSVAGYTKYQKVNGFFSDAILTLNYSKNNTYALMSSGAHANSKYHLFGGGLSLRSGVDIKLPVVTLQPYVGVSGIIVGSRNYHISNGMVARLGESRSLIAGWGIKAKRKFDFEPVRFEAYMNVSNEREFVDNNRVMVNNHRFTADMSGSWFKYAVGIKTPVYREFGLNLSYQMIHGKHIKSPGEFGLEIDYGF